MTVIVNISIFSLLILGCFKPIRFNLGRKIIKWLIKHNSIGLCYDICCLIKESQINDCIDLIIAHERYSGTSPRVIEDKISILPNKIQVLFWKNIEFQKFVCIDD